jgi:hypothetical protein
LLQLQQIALTATATIATPRRSGEISKIFLPAWTKRVTGISQSARIVFFQNPSHRRPIMRALSIARPRRESASTELTDEEFFAFEAAEEAWRAEMLSRLGQLLLNPSLDRCDITDGILGDRELIQFLSGFEHIVLEKVVPPGTTWAEMQQGKFTFGSILHESGNTSGTFVMPLMLGSLLDEDRQPWFQSSPFEFIPAIEGIQTSNLCGKPLFRADGGGSMSSSSISDKEKFSPSIFRCFELC